MTQELTPTRVLRGKKKYKVEAESADAVDKRRRSQDLGHNTHVGAKLGPD